MGQTDKLASLLLGEFDADTRGWLIEGFHDYLAGEPLEKALSLPTGGKTACYWHHKNLRDLLLR